MQFNSYVMEIDEHTVPESIVELYNLLYSLWKLIDTKNVAHMQKAVDCLFTKEFSTVGYYLQENLNQYIETNDDLCHRVFVRDLFSYFGDELRMAVSTFKRDENNSNNETNNESDGMLVFDWEYSVNKSVNDLMALFRNN